MSGQNFRERLDQNVKVGHLVIAIIGLCITLFGSVWAAASDRSHALDRIGVLEKTDTTHDAQIKDLQQERRTRGEDIATIKTDIGWIKRALGGK